MFLENTLVSSGLNSYSVKTKSLDREDFQVSPLLASMPAGEMANLLVGGKE